MGRSVQFSHFGPDDWPRLLPVLLAPAIGSFAGVLIERIPAGRPIAVARSCCNSCGRKLGPAELVPLASYVLQRGACRSCHAPVGLFHLQVELAAVAIALAVVVAQVDVTQAWAGCMLGWTLLALAWIDLRHHRLPDVLTLPLMVMGLVVTALTEPWRLTEHAAGAAAGYLVFRLIAAAYRHVRGRDGLGQGDAKLLAAAGAWVGWDGLDQVILIGAAVTLVVALYQARGRWQATRAVPFGPGLAIGLLVVRLNG